MAVRTSDGFEAEGWRFDLRGWTPSEGLADLRAGSAQRLADAWPEPWWTAVHVRDGAVLGAIPPTYGRLGLALCTALLGLVGRGSLRLVCGDRVRWAVRGQERRVAVDRLAGGVRVHAVDGSAREAGLEGLVLRRVRADDGARWADLVSAMRSEAPMDVPHAWLNMAQSPASAGGLDAWTALIGSEPELSARLVQEALVGVGCLGVPV